MNFAATAILLIYCYCQGDFGLERRYAQATFVGDNTNKGAALKRTETNL